MSKIALPKCILAGLLLVTIQLKGQDNPTQQPQILQGKTVRSAGQSGIVPVKDAIVSFVEASNEDPALAEYTAIATTVSDSQGAFELILGQFDPAGLYAIRARVAGDVWSTTLLGIGANEGTWINSVTITLGNTPSELDLLDKRVAVSREKDEQVKRQGLDAELQELKVERQLNDLETKETLPTPQNQSDQLRAQLNSIQVQRSQLEKAQSDNDALQQELRVKFQQAATHEAGGQYGTKRVIFATDRSVDNSQGSPQILNARSANGDLAFGLCDVAVERQGNFSNNLMHLIEDRDADRFYSVQKTVTVNKAAMWKEVDSELENSTSHDALVFIHGFNVSFDEGCRRAAQIAYDIKFKGPVFLYSWASHASIGDYAADGHMAELSEPHFTKFLRELLTKHEIEHVHIIAHSMGNRILMNTLFVDKLSATEQSHLGQVVFAAPDVSRELFDQKMAISSLKAIRVTLYASDHDQALAISKVINCGPTMFMHCVGRVGDARPSIEMKPGMDSVDASAVDTSLLGHSYIGASRSVLADFAALVSANTDPDKRFGVLAEGQPPDRWWLLNP